MGGFSLNPFFNTGKLENCDNLVIMTQLFSPVLHVVSRIKTGQVLDVVLLESNGPCIAVFEGEAAGTIISKELYHLINCIQRGKQFIGIVRDISGGSCSITIKAKENNG